MKKTLTILLALALVLSLSVMATTPVAAQTTWYVVEGGAGNQDGTGWDDAFATIGAAVAVASAGDTIEVAAGTYGEGTISIGKSLTIRGANSGVAAADGSGIAPEPRGPETIMTAGGPYVFRPAASDITIDGFKFTGGSGRLVDTYADSDNLTIKNCVFDVPSGAADGGVIQLGGGSKESLRILNNRFAGDGTSNWLYFGGTNHSDTIVQGNDFVGTGSRGMFQAGASGFTNALFNSNYFGSGIVTGINMGNLGAPVIEYNTFDGVIYAAMQIGTYPYGGSGGFVRKNILDGTGSGYYFGPPWDMTLAYGIMLWGGAWGTQACEGLTVQGNTVENYYDPAPGEDDYYVAIYLAADAGPDVTVIENSLQNNSVGVRVNTDRSGIVVSFNCIVDNTQWGVLSQKEPTIDAANNWWGDVSGPTHTTNLGGTGDPVSDGVDFDPWLTGLAYTGGTSFTEADAVVLQVTISSSDNGAPGAAVDFYVDGNYVGSTDATLNGVAELNIGTLAADNYEVTARAAGCFETTADLEVGEVPPPAPPTAGLAYPIWVALLAGLMAGAALLALRRRQTQS